MATTSCPRCHQKVDSQAVNCPYCRTALKAYGHPGIPLHRATGAEYLCTSCTYHADDTCTFPQRPYAQECTLYQNIEDSKLESQPGYKTSFGIRVKSWFQRHQAWLLLIALLLICFLVVLSNN